MNLVLIGYRGTGKSTIAQLLGARLQWPVLAIDAEIVRREGRSIPEIVADRGWTRFRDIESAVTAEASAGDGQVLDCGGGVILRPENTAALKANGHVTWLTAPIDVLAARIAGDANRPSLTGKPVADEVRDVLAEREPLYRAAADAIVDTGSDTPENCAERIAELFLAFSRAKGHIPRNPNSKVENRD